ncbi:hypothetical protein PENSPDRAFT_121812 [Peniophora sp. CONT]|nr:hypothetical protein PENSPDRAFT_121812 [Peniophora sp. CONT]
MALVLSPFFLVFFGNRRSTRATIRLSPSPSYPRSPIRCLFDKSSCPDVFPPSRAMRRGRVAMVRQQNFTLARRLGDLVSPRALQRSCIIYLCSPQPHLSTSH